MGREKEEEALAWYSQPLQGNRRASIPVFLACLGSQCWETLALWTGDPTDGLQTGFWLALFFIGLVFLPLGFIGGLWYRRYRLSAFAVRIALVSPPLWLGLFVRLHPYSPFDHVPPGFPWALWLCFQIPVALFVLWRSPLRNPMKRAITAGTVAGLLGLFVLQTILAQREVNRAPHVSDEYLCSVYQKNDVLALRRLDHKRIVVTGVVGSPREGLFGSGNSPPQMSGVTFNGFVPFDNADVGQRVSILGTCQGRDSTGTVNVTDCRVVP